MDTAEELPNLTCCCCALFCLQLSRKGHFKKTLKDTLELKSPMGLHKVSNDYYTGLLALARINPS